MPSANDARWLASIAAENAALFCTVNYHYV